PGTLLPARVLQPAADRHENVYRGREFAARRVEPGVVGGQVLVDRAGVVARDVAAPQFLSVHGARVPGVARASGCGGPRSGVSLIAASEVIAGPILAGVIVFGQLDAKLRPARGGQVHVERLLHGDRGDGQPADEGAAFAKIIENPAIGTPGDAGVI